jgi:hypothetical protein
VGHMSFSPSLISRVPMVPNLIKEKGAAAVAWWRGGGLDAGEDVGEAWRFIGGVGLVVE